MTDPNDGSEPLRTGLQRVTPLDEEIEEVLHGHEIVISAGGGGGAFQRHLQEPLFALRKAFRALQTAKEDHHDRPN
jgi:hypothetical protein